MNSSSAKEMIKKDYDIYLKPRNIPHTDTLIFLHGLGDTAAGWLDIFNTELSPVRDSTKVVLLTAPFAKVSINNGMVMPSWYDIKSLDSSARFGKMEENFGLDEIAKNSIRINKVISEEIKELKGKSRSVMVGGFSQGCAMALHVGLGYDQPLGAIIGLSGYLFPISKTHKVNDGLPIFTSHGLDDELIPSKSSSESMKVLDNGKRKFVRYLEPDLGHSVNENVLREARKFIEELYGKPKL